MIWRQLWFNPENQWHFNPSVSRLLRYKCGIESVRYDGRTFKYNPLVNERIESLGMFGDESLLHRAMTADADFRPTRFPFFSQARLLRQRSRRLPRGDFLLRAHSDSSSLEDSTEQHLSHGLTDE